MPGRVLGAIAVAATAGLTVLALAIPASAHTPDVKASCVKDEAVLTVNFKAYAPKEQNTILVKDGETVLEEAKFGEKFSKTFKKPGDVEHTFTIVVKAYDSSKYDYKNTVKTEKCVKTPPQTVSTPPSQTSSSVPVPSSETTAPSTTVPAPPAGAEPPLAATGASTTWTLLAGLGLVGAGAAALILVRRKRA
ncbi:LPXTG cell wall anchor domain-containing protein [Lentzea tibetensis]|uniref:LPXTG cell wall anchor domain-containing protein n=1 Tax=Lentzea tibetensis TaxID=2591470 RepID=A0A563ETR8_9PSEU|nr:LPXTG cell wall anchor domain-containing protein [Lentzea tibetensis]TWP50982.1 LPXTG cell wall anchor domain-containing protein [Lentzea tibetensis]